jgi:hypothetical protein
MAKKYTIERTDPTHGRIAELTIEGKKNFITDIAEYGSCMDWVAKHQKELKVYKIARTLHRKNGKRRFIGSIYAEDTNQAVRYFDDLPVTESDVTYQLLTGDWKIIAYFMVVNNVRGLTTLN